MEKLNLQEFVGQIAQQTGWTKKESDEVLKTFLSVITEGLETDEQVKIKGLGTFKRVWVEPRQSVNIKTGEKFEIAGHYKVSFAPEAELKDLINKPYAHLFTTYLAEGEKPAKESDDRLNLSKLSSEAQGLMAIIDEIKSQNKTVEIKEETAIVEKTAEKTQEEQPQVKVETAEPAVKTSAVKAAEPVVVAETPPIVSKTVETKVVTEKKKRRRGCALWLTVLGLLLLLALLYYFLFAAFKINFNLEEKRPLIELSSLIPAFNTGAPEIAIEPDVVVVDVPDSLAIDSIKIKNDSVPVVRELVIETPQETAAVSNAQPQYLDEVVVKPGDSLMKLAYKYYGNTAFWVYIFEANKDKIAGPSEVNIGTKLKIPKIDAALLDLNNPENEARVSQMKREILKNNYY